MTSLMPIIHNIHLIYTYYYYIEQNDVPNWIDFNFIDKLYLTRV